MYSVFLALLSTLLRSARSRADLLAEIAALRQQLGVLQRQVKLRRSRKLDHLCSPEAAPPMVRMLAPDDGRDQDGERSS